MNVCCCHASKAAAAAAALQADYHLSVRDTQPENRAIVPSYHIKSQLHDKTNAGHVLKCMHGTSRGEVLNNANTRRRHNSATEVHAILVCDMLFTKLHDMPASWTSSKVPEDGKDRSSKADLPLFGSMSSVLP